MFPLWKQISVLKACVFMRHVQTHWIFQRGNLCLRCRCHQCLLCLGARLLRRWDCPSSSSSRPPVTKTPPFPLNQASSHCTILQLFSVDSNGWVTFKQIFFSLFYRLNSLHKNDIVFGLCEHLWLVINSKDLPFPSFSIFYKYSLFFLSSDKQLYI